MSLISFVNSQEPDAEYISVTLTAAQVRKGFFEDSHFCPDLKGGYLVYVRDFSHDSLARAGRTAAQLHISRLKLSLENGAAPDFLCCYRFGQALYDGRHACQICLDLKDEEIARLNTVSSLVNTFRSVCNGDSKTLTPVRLCETLKELFTAYVRKAGGFSAVRIVTPKDESFKDYTGLAAVGQGSESEPCMGIFDYAPTEQALNGAPDVALVGKGITCDTGGYDLKPPKFMETMRTDKTAVINLTGALCLGALLGLESHVRLYLCCAENMISGRAMLPGDVITYPNGISVEITNTDAEGRLVLADGLLAASRSGAGMILDAATLTGAAKTALGRDRCAVFTRDNKAPSCLMECFETTGDSCWQLPFSMDYRQALSSQRADLANSGSGEAPGASSAAAFLEAFVDRNIPWVHIDLSSAYLPKASASLAEGPTGAMIFALASWLHRGERSF